MPPVRDLSSLWLLTAPLLLVLACSHDSPRENPFDPTLTPPVELQVTLDDTAGTATVTWTQYEGDQPFAAYWVLRNIDKSTEVDTLEQISGQVQTAYTDTSLAPGTDYVYRVSVVYAGGLEVASPGVRVRPLVLPPVAIRSLDFDSRTASAALVWTPYRGPRFQAYHIRRGTEELVSQTIQVLPDSAATSWTDSGLLGVAQYSYQVVVVTERGEEVASRQLSGGIHRAVTTWPLHVEGEGILREYVRLYSGTDGTVTALSCDQCGLSLRLFDPSGHLLAEQVVRTAGQRNHRSAAIAHTATGERWIATTGEQSPYGQWGVSLLDANGDPVLQDRVLFADAFTQPLVGEQSSVMGEIALAARGGHAFWDNVAVYSGGDLVFQEDFSGFPDITRYPEQVEGWMQTSPGVLVIREVGDDAYGWLTGSPDREAKALRRADASWQNVRLEADVNSMAGQAGLQIGGELHSRFFLGIDEAEQQVVLDWHFEPPEGSGAEPRDMRFAEPLTVLPALPYRLSL